MALYRCGDDVPEVAPTAWVAENAAVIGRVSLGEHSSVWYGCVLRGDNDWIRIGARCNIQDGAVLHIDAGVPLTLGSGVSVGHQAMLHGCHVGEGSLIGIRAVVLNHARIGCRCVVGAGSVVTEGKAFPDGSLIVGSPARVVRQLDAAQLERFVAIAGQYVEQAQRHRDRVQRVG